jgi:hypothetical protein
MTALEISKLLAEIAPRKSALVGTGFAPKENVMMSLVRLLGFTTLACGCVIGKYREVATSREVGYVEEKGQACGSHGHRRNHTVSVERLATVSPLAFTRKAS